METDSPPRRRGAKFFCPFPSASLRLRGFFFVAKIEKPPAEFHRGFYYLLKLENTKFAREVKA
jgi:hypothetical protein